MGKANELAVKKVKLSKWAKELLQSLAELDEKDIESRREGVPISEAMFSAGIIPTGGGAWVAEPQKVLDELEKAGFAVRVRREKGDRLILTAQGRRFARPWHYVSVHFLKIHSITLITAVLTTVATSLLAAWLVRKLGLLKGP